MKATARDATVDERVSMLDAYLNYNRMAEDEQPGLVGAYVVEKYMSGGPGYCGQVGILHFDGGPECMTVLTRLGDGWEVISQTGA